MNWLDIVILAMLAIGTITGLKNGLIKGVLNLAGIIIGIILAGKYYQSTAGVFSFVSNTAAQQIIAFIVIVALVMMAAAIAGWFLRRILSAIMLGWTDKLLGGVIGFLMAAIFWGAILAAWLQFLPGQADIVTGSAIAALLLNMFPIVLGLLPEQFDMVRGFFG
jgi:membrane protein required for colicin V production